MLNEKLQLLDYAKSLFNDVDLSKSVVIACQHLLKTNLIMFEYLFDMGLKPDNTFILGKCYSTDPIILERFEKLGVHVNKYSTFYDSHISFDEKFESFIIEFIAEIKSAVDLKKYDKIIIIDDGGFLISQANIMLKEFGNIVAVEQTSSGYRKLEDVNLNFPVINVARSSAKLDLESPFIAQIALENLQKHYDFTKNSSKKVLVIGIGAIGNNIFNILKKKFDVKRYDINNKNSDFSSNKLNEIIGDYDLVIGCTGQPILTQADYKSLKSKVTLVSVSSSDREFSAVDLRKLLPKNSDCHKDMVISGINLINSGFPINFNDYRESEPQNKIQLTRALMLSAVCLLINKDYKNGISEFDKDIQEKIVKQFNR